MEAEQQADAHAATKTDAGTTTNPGRGEGSERGPGREGKERVPRGPEASTRPEITPLETLQFRAIMNANYHQDMERFYDQLHRALMMIVVLSGSGAVTTGFIDLGVSTVWPAAIAAAAGLIDLVFDVFGKTAQHKQLRWRALDIFADSHEPDASTGGLTARLVRLYPDESPENAIVTRLAYNQANETLGRNKDERYVIQSRYRIFRHWMPWARPDIKTAREIADAEKQRRPASENLRPTEQSTYQPG